MSKISKKQQFELLSQTDLFSGAEQIITIFQGVNPSLSREQAFQRRAELFSFTKSEFEKWTETVDLHNFARAAEEVADGLYLIEKSPHLWICYWQEREIKSNVKQFTNFRAAKMTAIRERCRYLLGGYNF